jgi:hypothetical protein
LDRVIAKLDSDLGTIPVLPKVALTKIANVSFWIEHDNPDVPGLSFIQAAMAEEARLQYRQGEMYRDRKSRKFLELACRTAIYCTA